MEFEEVLLEEDFEFIDMYDLDGFHSYWMDEVDPRNTKKKAYLTFKFEQACGSGEWDY